MTFSAVQLAQAIAERRGRLASLPEVDFVRVSAGEIVLAVLSALPRIDDPAGLQGGYVNGDRLDFTFCRTSVGRGRDLQWRIIASDRELLVGLETGTFDQRLGQHLQSLLSSKFGDVAAAIAKAGVGAPALDVRFDQTSVPLAALAAVADGGAAQFNLLPDTVSAAVQVDARTSAIDDVCAWIAAQIRALRPIYDLLAPSLRLFVVGMTEEEEANYAEGAIAYRVHRIRERDPQVIAEAKDLFRARHGGRLSCEICGFDFEITYGERGRDFAEGHHTRPVSTLLPGDVTLSRDICIVCSNCHRMCHRSPLASPDVLRSLLEVARAQRGRS